MYYNKSIKKREMIRMMNLTVKKINGTWYVLKEDGSVLAGFKTKKMATQAKETYSKK